MRQKAERGHVSLCTNALAVARRGCLSVKRRVELPFLHEGSIIPRTAGGRRGQRAARLRLGGRRWLTSAVEIWVTEKRFCAPGIYFWPILRLLLATPATPAARHSRSGNLFPPSLPSRLRRMTIDSFLFISVLPSQPLSRRPVRSSRPRRPTSCFGPILGITLPTLPSPLRQRFRRPTSYLFFPFGPS
jgi:hypothetical protein